MTPPPTNSETKETRTMKLCTVIAYYCYRKTAVCNRNQLLDFSVPEPVRSQSSLSNDLKVLQNCTGFTLCSSAGLAVGECSAVMGLTPCMLCVQIYTVLQKYAHIGLKQNLLRSITLDIITRLLDNAAFVCIQVVGGISKDFSEVRGLRSREFQLQAEWKTTVLCVEL